MSEQPSLIDALLELAVYAPVGLAVTVAEELPGLIEKGRSRIEPQVGTAQFVGRLVVAEGRRRANKMAGFGTSTSSDSTASDSTASDTAASTGRGTAAAGGTGADTAATAPTGSAPAGSAPDATVPTAPAPEQPSASRRSPQGQRAPSTRKRAAASRSTASPAPAPAKRTAAAGSRGRRSVPEAGSLAIPGYDALSASQVVARLAGLSPRELSAVGRYEAANRGRRTILTRVSQLEGG